MSAIVHVSRAPLPDAASLQGMPLGSLALRGGRVGTATVAGAVADCGGPDAGVGVFVCGPTAFVEAMIDLLQRTGLDERSEVTATGHFPLVLAEHAQVEAAIARGDAAGAAAAMRVHLSSSRARLRA